MCEPASFIVTLVNGDYVAYWSKNSDSHEVIKKENGLLETDKKTNVRGEPKIIPCEIVPPAQDYRLPLQQWQFKSDLSPEWADMVEVERACRKELPNWLVVKIVLPDEKREKINIGRVVAIYGQVENICGSAQVKYIFCSAQVENICGSAQVKYICDSAQVENICDSAQVKNICDSAQVKNICDSAQVKNIYGSAQVKNICDSAQVENIYGSAQVKYICDSAQVENIFCSAQVEKATGSVLITTYNNLSPEILKSSKAVMIDRSKNTVVCYVGKD